MDFLTYLVDKYGYNEPILLHEISFGDYSKPWINKQLAHLCECGELIRFEKGVYYVPQKTILGSSKLNPLKVIEKKYIMNGELGYYSGAYFLNQIGLSDQVPNSVEIYTNCETSKVREIFVGSIKVILRKSRISVNKNNVAVQSFLELMNSVSPSFFNESRKGITTDYIKKYGITRSDITKYAPSFPDKSLRTLIESEMIYLIAQ